MKTRSFLQPTEPPIDFAWNFSLSPNSDFLVVTGAVTAYAPPGLGVLDLTDGSTKHTHFQPVDRELWTGDVVFLNDHEVLTSGRGANPPAFDLPLRRTNLASGASTIITTAGPNSRLYTDHNASVVGFSSSVDNTEIGLYLPATDEVIRSDPKSILVPPVAISHSADRLAVQSHNGVAILSQDLALVSVVHDTSIFPIPVSDLLFSPVNDVLFRAVGESSIVLYVHYGREYKHQEKIDVFSASQNESAGHLYSSRDGRWLFATTINGIRVYDVSAVVPESASIQLFSESILVVLLGLRIRRVS